MSVMAVLCLVHSGVCQNMQVVPFQIGERVPDLPLKNILNYKKAEASFSSFGHKVIVLNFWHTRCGTCIALFPQEDTLQYRYKDRLQFLLVTGEGKDDVEAFLQDRHSRHLPVTSAPIITGDIWLNKMFRHIYNPHYVFLSPDGKLLAQTSSIFLAENIIKGIVDAVGQKDGPNATTGFPQMDDLQRAYFKHFSY